MNQKSGGACAPLAPPPCSSTYATNKKMICLKNNHNMMKILPVLPLAGSLP